MSKIVKGENLKNSAEENLKETIISLPKTKQYFVETDEEGNIKGYFPLKEKSLGKDWFAMYQNPALWLALQDMTGEQYKILWVLFSKLDFDNYLRVGLKEIADILKLRISNVSRAMKVIVEGPPAGKFKTYRLNPYIAHKGKNRSNTIIDFESAMVDKGKNMLRASDVSDFNQKKSPSNAEEENEEKEN